MAEKEYIERENARPDAFCIGVSCQDCPFLKSPLYGGCRIDDFITSISPADVRPVITCENCKHNKRAVIDFLGTPAIQCVTGQTHHREWFCADGERKSNA